jgi:hypothetical protein
MQKMQSPRKKTKATGVATRTSNKGGSCGDDGGGDMPLNSKEMMMTTTVPKRGNGKDKDGGGGHKTVHDVQKNDGDSLVATVADIDQGGDDTEQVASPSFMLYAIIY